jgi:hypothetical protein
VSYGSDHAYLSIRHKHIELNAMVDHKSIANNESIENGVDNVSMRKMLFAPEN